MSAYKLALVVISLLANHISLSAAAACDDLSKLDINECQAARDSIAYVPGQNVIKSVERSIQASSGKCMIQVLVVPTPSPVISKNEIDTTINDILACGTHAGKNDPVKNIQVMVSGIPDNYTDTYGPNQKMNTAVCNTDANGGKNEKQDCLDAFKKITTNNLGQLLDTHGQPSNHTYTTVKTCTVQIFSTNGLPVNEKLDKLSSSLNVILDTCHKQSGYLALHGGTEGLNGRLSVKTGAF
ncbi:hypothetical protein PGTUg99_012259 [Puccinia graminis f. sp. tritici]|uniref:Secreted protein n=1 Tax=Puccinia graminis f. sp. tritici TaxID=56615 RepID=A0A5B0M1H0_PUCGR|nr:hypothetical protein PGTUg99_012259 [Puccinia graminis f. sp. tritici]